MTVTVRPICLGCKFFKPDAPELVCDAFPNGIPAEILRNETDHRKPFATDHETDRGIQFDAKTPADADYAEGLFK